MLLIEFYKCRIGGNCCWGHFDSDFCRLVKSTSTYSIVSRGNGYSIADD